MKHPIVAILPCIAALVFPVFAEDASLERPQIGKVEIFKTSDLRPGM